MNKINDKNKMKNKEKLCPEKLLNQRTINKSGKNRVSNTKNTSYGRRTKIKLAKTIYYDEQNSLEKTDVKNKIDGKVYNEISKTEKQVKTIREKKKKGNSLFEFKSKIEMRANKGKNIMIRESIKPGNFIMVINYILILSLLIQTKSRKEMKFKIFHFSKITFKIKGIGYNNIFGIETNYAFKRQYYPNEIYINGYKQNNITHSYYFNLTDNFVELIWNNSIANCWNMFRRCYNITEFNLSNFDTSQVTSTGGMFLYCSSLTSLDVSNFNTSQLVDVNCMFQGCSSLTTLNLSNFDTSKIWYMDNFFYCCSSLTSLDLSNFDTSQLTKLKMNNMFYGCENLEYINMKNYVTNNLFLETYSNIFSNVSKNIVICINEKQNSTILSQISNIKCSILNCSDDWKSNQKK